MTYDLIIIGGGPAGITAGIYATRQKLDTLLIAKDFGGQMTKKTVDIENYPGIEKISGMELLQQFEQHLRKYNIKIERDLVVNLKKTGKRFSVSIKSKKKFESKAVIIASGSDPRLLDVPGEERFLGKGVSYCAVCDGPVFAGKEVAVIGSGNSAFETAIFLSNYVKKIYILINGSEIKANKSSQETVGRTKNIELITNTILGKIQGDKLVKSIVYRDSKTKKDKTLSVGGVFAEIGYKPATSFIKGLVGFNKQGEILVNPNTGETKTSGLFAAGDVDSVEYKQIIIACGKGARAAISAYNYLKKT